MKILLLTNNILAEKILQDNIQQLGHEIYVSKSFVDESKISRNFDFNLYIFSNTLSKRRSDKIISRNSIEDNKIIYKSEPYYYQNPFNVINQNPTNKHLTISEDEPLEVLEEKFDMLLQPNNSFYSNDFSDFNFSTRERKVISLLVSKLNEPCSRDELCSSIWIEGATTSTLSQLSTLIKRINIKLSKNQNTSLRIKTVWGKGYQCFEE